MSPCFYNYYFDSFLFVHCTFLISKRDPNFIIRVRGKPRTSDPPALARAHLLPCLPRWSEGTRLPLPFLGRLLGAEQIHLLGQ